MASSSSSSSSSSSAARAHAGDNGDVDDIMAEFRQLQDDISSSMGQRAVAQHLRQRYDDLLAKAKEMPGKPNISKEAETTLLLLAKCYTSELNQAKGLGDLSDPTLFFEGLRKYFPAPGRPGKVDLEAFGRAFSRLWFGVPYWSPMLGAMSVELKVRGSSNRGIKADPEARAAEKASRAANPMLQGLSSSKDTVEKERVEAATEIQRAEAVNASRSNRLHQLLKELPNRRPDLAKTGMQLVGVDKRVARPLLPFMRTLVDGWSYTQTVENIFYFSFLVKEGLAGVFRAKAEGSSSSSSSSADSEQQQQQHGEVYITVYEADEAVDKDLHLFENPYRAGSSSSSSSSSSSASSGGGDGDGAEEDESGGSGSASSGSSRGRRASAGRAAAAAAARAQGSSTLLSSMARQFVVEIDIPMYEDVCEIYELGRYAGNDGRDYTPPLDHYRSQDSTAPKWFTDYYEPNPNASTGSKGKQAASLASSSSSSSSSGAAVGSKRSRKGFLTQEQEAADDDEEEEDDDRKGSAAKKGRPSAKKARKGRKPASDSEEAGEEEDE